MWGIWGSYYDIPKAIFYLLKGGHMLGPLASIILVHDFCFLLAAFDDCTWDSLGISVRGLGFRV